jgi:hypothetical protein
MTNSPATGVDLSGGGIYVWQGSKLVSSGPGNIVSGSSAYSGGGVYTWAGVDGLAILNNWAENGGGMYVASTPGILIANNLVAGNSAGTGGAGVYLVCGNKKFVNNTVVGNGGGARSGVETACTGTGTVTLTNNIVVGHEIGIKDRRGTISVTLVTNNVWDNDTNYDGVVPGISDIHQQPKFVHGEPGNYHLAPESPLIDAGTTVTSVANDFDRHPRPMGPAYDIGFDEFTRNIHLPLSLRSS